MTAGLRIRPSRRELRRRALELLAANPGRDWTAREMLPLLGLNPYSQAAALRDELKGLADRGAIARIDLREPREAAVLAYSALP